MVQEFSRQWLSGYVNSPVFAEALAYLPSLLIWSLVFYVSFRIKRYYAKYKKNVEFKDEHLLVPNKE
jgi:hypothetical protein